MAQKRFSHKDHSLSTQKTVRDNIIVCFFSVARLPVERHQVIRCNIVFSFSVIKERFRDRKPVYTSWFTPVKTRVDTKKDDFKHQIQTTVIWRWKFIIEDVVDGHPILGSAGRARDRWDRISRGSGLADWFHCTRCGQPEMRFRSPTLVRIFWNIQNETEFRKSLWSSNIIMIFVDFGVKAMTFTQIQSLKRRKQTCSWEWEGDQCFRPRTSSGCANSLLLVKNGWKSSTYFLRSRVLCSYLTTRVLGAWYLSSGQGKQAS